MDAHHEHSQQAHSSDLGVRVLPDGALVKSRCDERKHARTHVTDTLEQTRIRYLTNARSDVVRKARAHPS